MTPACWMFETQPQQGGSNMQNGQPRIIVRRSAAIGDALAATVVADRLKELGYECEFQTHPNIHCLLRYVPSISHLSTPAGYAHVDLDRSYEQHPGRRNKHFSEVFIERAAELLRPYGISLGGPLNCRPSLRLPRHITEAAIAKLNDYPKPWIMVVPKSEWYSVRTVPDAIWTEVASCLSGYTCFWSALSPGPKGLIDLEHRQLSTVLADLSAAHLVVSVDTGPMHIAASLGRKLLCLGQSSSPELHLSDQRDFETVWPEENLTCLNCQENYCKIQRYMPPCQRFDPDKLAQLILRKFTGGISCVIPTTARNQDNLNRCIQCIAPQVDEIVVATDAGAADFHSAEPKVRIVRARLPNLYFGRTVNFGVRHAAGKYVLILNDDVFLNPDSVARLRDCMGEEVGLVGHLLRYPDGTIYHGGVARAKGSLDWGHIDHRATNPSIHLPCEMEQVTGASILVRREAFYQAGAFDESYVMYCEDNDLCMKIRQAGWKIFYTPRAVGVHVGSATAKDIPGIGDIMRQSIRHFHSKWDWYLKKNINNTLGTFT